MRRVLDWFTMNTSKVHPEPNRSSINPRKASAVATPYLRIDYTLGPVAAGSTRTELAYNDLATAAAGPLTGRVGLGRILTLPHILETPIQLRVHRPDDLTGWPRQLVAQLLEPSGSTLLVAGAPVVSDPQCPTGQILAPLTNPVLGRLLRAAWEGDDHLAVRQAAHRLLVGLELTGPQAARVLNAVPSWRRRTTAAAGHTRHTLRSAVHSARPENADIPAKLGLMTLDDTTTWEWEHLPGQIIVAAQLGAQVTVPAQRLTEQLRTPERLLVLDQILRCVNGRIDPAIHIPPVDPTTGQALTDASRFITDIVTSRFLAPNRTHPPRDRTAAHTIATDLRGRGTRPAGHRPTPDRSGLPDSVRTRLLATRNHPLTPGEPGMTTTHTPAPAAGTNAAVWPPRLTWHARQRMATLRIPHALIDATLHTPQLTWPGRRGCTESSASTSSSPWPPPTTSSSPSNSAPPPPTNTVTTTCITCPKSRHANLRQQLRDADNWTRAGSRAEADHPKRAVAVPVQGGGPLDVDALNRENRSRRSSACNSRHAHLVQHAPVWDPSVTRQNGSHIAYTGPRRRASPGWALRAHRCSAPVR